MLPRLSERAGSRCTAHIRRFYPDWLQARVRQSGEGLNEMECFIGQCKEHLADLKHQIAEGETPCIDTRWPMPDNPVEQPAIEPASADDPDLDIPHPAAAMLDQMEAVKTKIDERPADPLDVPEEPPESIADLFQTDRPYADQAKALWDKYNELTQKIMMNLATDAERSKHAKLQGELDWIKHHVFEAV